MFAYFFGIKFGKHKLAPLISPKKSIEGLIAGTIIGASIGILYTQIRPVPVVSELPLLWIVGLSVLLSLLGQLGDLFASKIKRAQNIKDFGDLFPGHGGLLDRFDSLCMSALLYFIIVSL
jgi:phosphatidate cytidylyltransferase